jgi:enoyl-CoA hydratase
MVAYKHIRYETDERIARVILNRPRFRNAQSRLMLEEIDRALAAAADDNEVRVIILSGEGEHFSSGHDIGTEEETEDRKQRPYSEGIPGEFKRSWDIYNEMGLRWRDVPKPTIAQVQGYCIFGGWMVASAMDIIVSSEDAQFLPAHFQYFSVPWDISPRKTKEILWQSRFLDASEAADLGLVNHVVPREDLGRFTEELAGQIARMDPFAARMVKLSVNQAQDAAGFRTAIQAAHSNYILIQSSGSRDIPKDERGRPRLGGVKRAMKQREGGQDGR